MTRSQKQKSISIVLVFLGLALLSDAFAVQEAFAQTKAKLVGKVTDKESGEELIGVSVIVVGISTGSLTNVDGEYSLLIEPGTYDIRYSYVGYQLLVKQVIVKSPLTRQDVQLKTENVQAEEIVVQAEVSAATEGALLTQRRKSNSVSDAISAEQIKKTPDSDAAEAARRITGVSLVGGKFVYVRGLGERYSSTQLNGVTIPSPEPDKKVVPFDIIPANLVESITTIKTFLPDQPGTFAGGLVKIKTKEFPDEFQMVVGVSSGLNTNANFRDIPDYTGGSADFVGFDDTRRLPSGIPDYLTARQTTRSGNRQDQVAILSRLNNSQFTPVLNSFGPSQGYSLAIADQLNIGIPMGYIASISYANEPNFRDVSLLFPNNVQLDIPGRFQYNARISSYTINWGGIAHFNFRFSDNDKIGIKATYNRSAEDEIRIATGFEQDPDFTLLNRSTRLRFVARELFSGQLTGNHYISALGKSELEWKVQYAIATRNEPDNRETFYNGPGLPVGNPLRGTVQDTTLFPTAFRNLRFFADNSDREVDFLLDWNFPFEQWDGLKSKFKIGGLFTNKARVFTSRRFAYRFSPSNLPPNQLFTAESVGRGLIQFQDDTLPQDNYDANEIIGAAYLMLELPLTSYLRFVGGVRVENNILDVRSNIFGGFGGGGGAEQLTPLTAGFRPLNILPSANFIYAVGDQMNFRAGVSLTVAQPELRELAPFRFDEYLNSTIGNPALSQTRIFNADFRWEMFPRFGELFAISLFYKTLQLPLERFVQDEGVTVPLFTTFNGETGQNIGAEFEVRKNLDFISLREFSVSLNFTLVQSVIRTPARITIANESAELVTLNVPEQLRQDRKLQGQSPFVFNANLAYDNAELGLSAILLYNIVGRRISLISGSVTVNNFFEEPRNQLDFSFTKSFGKLGIKLNAKNILDDRFLFTSETPRGTAETERFTIGRTFTFSVAYSL